MPKHVLDGRHHDVDVERQRDAAGHAQQQADDADQRALDDEHLHDAARTRAERAQDGDVGLLVGHRHDQRRTRC